MSSVLENISFYLAGRSAPALSLRSFLAIFTLVTIGWNAYGVYLFTDIEKYWNPESGYVNWIQAALEGWFTLQQIPMIVVPPLLLTILSFIAPIILKTNQRLREASPETQKEIIRERNSSYAFLAFALVVTFAIYALMVLYLIVTGPF